MARIRSKGRPRGIVPFIILMLMLSGALRLGEAGVAIAKNSGGASAIDVGGGPKSEPTSDLAELMEMLNDRSERLDAREEELVARAKALDEAEAMINENLMRLEAVEKQLADTIAKVDGASEQDVQQLTTVYETMKPKLAAQLFEQMAPEFAAGFLGQMSPAAAAGIMSSLSAEKAHEISVIIAGRNANAPKQ